MSRLLFYSIRGISRHNVCLDIEEVTPIAIVPSSNFRIFNENKKIKVSSETYNVTKANYLCIESQAGEFIQFNMYYYINDITYINTTMVELDISIDTITTFKNVLKFKHLERTRTGNYSNIRENVSRESTFYLNNYNTIDTNNGYMIVVRYKKPFDITLTPAITENLNSYTDTLFYNYDNPTDSTTNYKSCFTDGLGTLYIPFPITVNNSSPPSVYYYDNGSVEDNEIAPTDFARLIHQLSNHPAVMNMYITRYLPKNVGYSSVNNSYYMNVTRSDDVYYKKVGNGLIFISTRVTNQTLDVAYNYPVTLGQITTPSREVCDSNYTKFYIGEKGDNVVTPIEYLSPNTNYTVYGKIDYSSGQRMYYIDNELLIKYNFVHICNSVETLPLFNDNYNIYLSQNKGSLTTGIATKNVTNFYNSLSGIITSGVKGATSADYVSGIGTAITGVGASIANSFMSEYTLEQAIKENKENALWSPDNTKIGNNFSSDVMIRALDRVIIEFRVGDYDDISYIRGYYGYPCHKTSGYINKSFLTVAVEDPVPITQNFNKYILVGDCIPYVDTNPSLVSKYYDDIVMRIREGLHIYDKSYHIGF